jgi:hypothetical protein
MESNAKVGPSGLATRSLQFSAKIGFQMGNALHTSKAIAGFLDNMQFDRFPDSLYPVR